MSAIMVVLGPPIMYAADPDSCTQLMDVPVALLTSILGHVPLLERLSVCTRVCRAFHAAALAATNIIATSMRTQAECDGFGEWMQRHGGGVTAIQMMGHGLDGLYLTRMSSSSLPCPQLKSLGIIQMSLQAGVFSACTSLTRLLLWFSDVERSPKASTSAVNNPLTQLSVLRSLQHLGLDGVRAGCSATASEDTVLDLPSSLLSQLVQLTYLHLGPYQVQSDAALQHLHAVTGLQHLDLQVQGWGQPHPTAAALAGLQHLQHLTSLRLQQAPWAINLHNMPALTMLTTLRVLKLGNSSSVDPAVLAKSSQLQELELTCKEAWDAEGSAALLAAIGQQAQLTRLALTPDSIWRPPSAAAYSALKASSHLQSLQLMKCELPACAWQQMFPPTRCLPELHYLGLDAEETGGDVCELSPADMQAMVSCCPALARVSLGAQLAISTAAPLAQLTSLTYLSMPASFQSDVPSIARLTGLQHLVLLSNKPGNQVTISGLLQLTMLQQLQDMRVEGHAFDLGLVPPDAGVCGLEVVNDAPAGAPPDVWLQLKEHCEAAQVQAGCWCCPD